MTNEPKRSLFSVSAEKKGYEKPLLQMRLTFARLVDEVVKPYEENEPFFIDGVPVKRDDLQRIKILEEDDQLAGILKDLHEKITYHNPETSKLLVSQYGQRVEAILRSHSSDVTSQVIRAYSSNVRPKLKDYLPRREEILETAWRAFFDSMKSLTG